jgi:hypothetical protein
MIRSEQSRSITRVGRVRDTAIMRRLSWNELLIFFQSALILFAGGPDALRNDA